MQYFNQAITAKPYLYEPWFLRGIAKYNLDDFQGAEQDCTEAIERNPYIVGIYELRGLTRIRQQKFAEAINDYNRALRYAPDNRSLWHNRVLCHIQNEEYDQALAELDTIQARWNQYAPAWAMRADVYMQQKDTAKADEALAQSLEIDPYDGTTWAARSIISLQREQWKQAEEQLDHAIHLLPKNATYYINRALARYNRNNLRGAMSDYDAALDLEPNNFLGHYNRGLLRADVGDDNRAITDFDFVLRLEPDNMQALFNRAVLLDRTGDLEGAVRDYTKVIEAYPNFQTGILYRAQCYRRMGQTAKAELEEFRVYRTQLYQHLYGIQPRDGKRKQRKRSDLNPDKYNELVVADEQEPEREYQSDYRGRVQDRHTDMELMPMFALSLQAQHDDVRQSTPYDATVEEYNEGCIDRPLYVSNQNASLSTDLSTDYFAYIDSLTTVARNERNVGQAARHIFARAVAHYATQDHDAAIDDLTACLQIDSTMVLALWQRAVCLARQAQFLMSEGTNAQLKLASAMADIDKALSFLPQNAFLHYNRGNLCAMQHQYADAIDHYTAALQADSRLPEAYYNRAFCFINMGQTADAISDLSKAGELGVYQAYSIIKKYTNQNGRQ